MKMLLTLLCQACCDLMDYSLSGSSVHGVLQARILEWVTIALSRGSSRLRGRTLVSCIARWILFQLNHHGSLIMEWVAIAFSALSW